MKPRHSPLPVHHNNYFKSNEQSPRGILFSRFWVLPSPVSLSLHIALTLVSCFGCKPHLNGFDWQCDTSKKLLLDSEYSTTSNLWRMVQEKKGFVLRFEIQLATKTIDLTWKLSVTHLEVAFLSIHLEFQVFPERANAVRCRRSICLTKPKQTPLSLNMFVLCV